MRIIVPCAGSSSRFPNMAPKWMLPDHDGVPMVVRAVEGLNRKREDFVFTILRSHEELFGASKGLEHAFGGKVECLILDEPTKSQSETVARTLEACRIEGPFLVKDSDNFFELVNVEEPFNYISVSSLNDFDMINARNKSYVQVDQENTVLGIREKHVISDLFSVGGYYFQSGKEFLDAFNKLSGSDRLEAGELYISEIISYMILEGAAFQTKRALRYQDWGTVHEWRQELSRRRMFLVSLDGFVFERGSAHFAPSFADAQPHAEAVDALRQMADRKQTIIYLSIRPESLRDMTEQQLQRHGLPPGPIIFGCGVAQWSLVTSSHSSLPFTTAHALELAPDDTNLLEKLDFSKLASG